MHLYTADTADPEGAARLAGRLGPDAEWYVAEDGGGYCLIAEETVPPEPGFSSVEARILFAGGHYGAEGGDYLFKVGLWAPPEYAADVIAWYEQEHMPMLLDCPCWDGCRFVEVPAATGCKLYALHQLAGADALDAPERERSRGTAWFRRLAIHDWFDGAFERCLYQRTAR